MSMKFYNGMSVPTRLYVALAIRVIVILRSRGEGGWEEEKMEVCKTEAMEIKT
jgi:hypothetical protein